MDGKDILLGIQYVVELLLFGLIAFMLWLLELGYPLKPVVQAIGLTGIFVACICAAASVMVHGFLTE